jgi:hypothetical protein
MRRVMALAAISVVLTFPAVPVTAKETKKPARDAVEGRDDEKSEDELRAELRSLLRTIVATQVTLADQQAKLLVDLSGIRADLGNLQNQMGDLQSACAPPDLVPVAVEGSAPPSYCRRDPSGNLIVRVKNQGSVDAIASTLRVTFQSAPNMPVDVATPLLPGLFNGGGFVDLPVPIPANCFDPPTDPNSCFFQIAVDIAGVVIESNEANNNVAGSCPPIP